MVQDFVHAQYHPKHASVERAILRMCNYPEAGLGLCGLFGICFNEIWFGIRLLLHEMQPESKSSALMRFRPSTRPQASLSDGTAVRIGYILPESGFPTPVSGLRYKLTFLR